MYRSVGRDSGSDDEKELLGFGGPGGRHHRIYVHTPRYMYIKEHIRTLKVIYVHKRSYICIIYVRNICTVALAGIAVPMTRRSSCDSVDQAADTTASKGVDVT